MGNKNFYDFRKGISDGIPVFLGYIAVSFTFGILAKKAGLSILQAVLISATNFTSAGQFAGVSLISAGSAYWEMAMTQLIINSRYVLMSCALSQKVDSKTPVPLRALMATGITDEVFGLSISSKGKLNPFYTYGAMTIGLSGWVLGTLLGAVSGNILPERVISALSIALYGMLISIIIPPSVKNKVIRSIVAVSMAASFIFSTTPFLKNISSGMKIILLTILITSIFAKFFPVEEEENSEK